MLGPGDGVSFLLKLRFKCHVSSAPNYRSMIFLVLVQGNGKDSSPVSSFEQTSFRRPRFHRLCQLRPEPSEIFFLSISLSLSISFSTSLYLAHSVPLSLAHSGFGIDLPAPYRLSKVDGTNRLDGR